MLSPSPRGWPVMEARAGPFVIAATAVRVIAVANTRSRFCNFASLCCVCGALVRSNGTHQGKFIHSLSQGGWFGELLFPASRERLVHQRQDHFHVLTLRRASSLSCAARASVPDVNQGFLGSSGFHCSFKTPVPRWLVQIASQLFDHLAQLGHAFRDDAPRSTSCPSLICRLRPSAEGSDRSQRGHCAKSRNRSVKDRLLTREN